MNRQQLLFTLRSLNIKFDEAATNRQLQALIAKNTKAINTKRGRILIKNADAEGDEDGPVEIMLCDEIGKDPWSGEGITVNDIKTTLDAITPRGRDLNFLTNSPGGYCAEGVAIRNLLNQWPGKITNTIIGVAASTASWCIPADEVRAYKSSQMFIHRAWGIVMGNADDMRDAIGSLEKLDGQIAQMYADDTGRPAAEMLDMMGEETLLTGQEALEEGFVDTLIDGEPMNKFTPGQLNAMKQHLASLNSIRSANGLPPAQGERTNTNHQPQDTNVNRTQKIALLNSWGLTIKDEASVTDARIDELVNLGKAAALAEFNKTANPPAQQPGNLIDLQSQINQMKKDNETLLNANTEAKRQRLTGEVKRLITEDRVPEALEKETLEDLMKDESRLEKFYNKLPPKRPGADPVGTSVEESGSSFKDVQEFVLNNSSRFRRKFLGKNAGDIRVDDTVRKEIAHRAMAAATAIQKNKAVIVAAWNANAIDADLQRHVILQDMTEAYAIVLLPLDAFTVKWENIPLQGDDTVVVPYFPLQANASQQFAKATGFNTANDWTQNSRKIVIGGDGDTNTSGANATAGTAKDRLYQRLDFYSYDMRRQPYLNVMKLAQQAANKLGVDVWNQIVSRVIVTGNFGAAVKTIAAALFSADDIAELEASATGAFWPVIARSLTLSHQYKTPLLKDNTFKQYLSYGSTDPIRKAMIQEAYGFSDMYFIPNLDGTLAANATGWINHQSAIGVAFAPIMPTEEVRALLTTYDISVEPRSGAILEYRKQANVTLDRTEEIIQSCFGAAKLVDAALQIIKKQ